jgi:glyoxylase-like metal-dependent hydrolase (beta-lactamase superfamily II)
LGFAAIDIVEIIRAYGRLQSASVRARTLWAAAASTGILIGAAAAARSAPGEADGFDLTEVKPGVYAAVARPGDDSTIGNAGFVVGSDAVLVVDSFATPAAAERLLARIRKATPRPIRWLIDTHHHLDHWGGNSVFAKAGATVVAQENARTGMQARATSPDAQDATDRARRALVLPTVTYREAMSIWLGDRRVDVFTKPGHTHGDSLVSVPDADVLFGGDLLQKNTVPNLADARIDAWIRTLDELAPRFPTATIVPGHGGVARPLDIRGLRDFLVTVRLAVARGLAEGKSGPALAEEVVPQLAPFRKWTWSEHLDGAVADAERQIRDTAANPTPPSVPTPFRVP